MWLVDYVLAMQFFKKLQIKERQRCLHWGLYSLSWEWNNLLSYYLGSPPSWVTRSGGNERQQFDDIKSMLLEAEYSKHENQIWSIPFHSLYCSKSWYIWFWFIFGLWCSCIYLFISGYSKCFCFIWWAEKSYAFKLLRTSICFLLNAIWFCLFVYFNAICLMGSTFHEDTILRTLWIPTLALDLLLSLPVQWLTFWVFLSYSWVHSFMHSINICWITKCQILSQTLGNQCQTQSSLWNHEVYISVRGATR